MSSVKVEKDLQEVFDPVFNAHDSSASSGNKIAPLEQKSALVWSSAAVLRSVGAGLTRRPYVW
jgi:hypothetical protein